MKKYTHDIMNFIINEGLDIPEDLLNVLKEEMDVNGHHYYRFFYKIAFLAQPNLIVELGTYKALGCKSFKVGCPEARVITMDIRQNPDRKFGTPGVEYWECSSLDPKEELHDIDILFIDTEHDGMMPMLEFEKYKDNLSAHAIVFFDDVNLNAEMIEFWQGFNPDGFEKFELPLHGDAGFGILIKQ